MGLATRKLAIDLGSSTTRIYVPRKGIVLSQPSLVAKDEALDSFVAIGDDAIDMAGRSSDTITIIYPLQAGVIADFGAATAMLKQFLGTAVGRFQIKKPEAMITVSGSATSTERRALIDAGREAGLQQVFLIRGAVAAALGAGLPITEPRGNLIVDMGAGTTEIGVFSLGGIVAQGAIRVGGNAIDESIQRFMRREHGMQIGGDETRRIKTEFLSLKLREAHTMTVHGRSTIQGLPKSTTVKLPHLQSYVETTLERIVIAIRRVLEQTPPDLISDIIRHGLILSGGSAQIGGLSEYFTKRLHVACIVAQDPQLCTIKGAHMALTHLDDYKRSLLA